jgi:hypothetical protein
VIGYDIATGAFHDHGMLGPGPGYALRKGQDVLERLDRGLFFLIADVAEDIRP